MDNNKLEAAISFIRSEEVQDFIAKLESYDDTLDDNDRLGVHYDGALNCLKRLVEVADILQAVTVGETVDLPPILTPSPTTES